MNADMKFGKDQAGDWWLAPKDGPAVSEQMVARNKTFGAATFADEAPKIVAVLGVVLPLYACILSTEWYVATVKPFAEEMVAEGLTEQGFEIYLPLKFTKWTDGRKVLARPSLRFEGYVFIKANMAEGHARPINGTRGIDHLLPPGDQAPRALPDFWVPEMRAYELLEFFRAKSRKKQVPRKDLRPGDQVTIDKPGDLWHGNKGELMKIDQYIASVLLGMVIVKLPAIDLRKIEEDQQQVA